MHVHILYTINTSINAEPNFYDFHCQVLFIQTIYKLEGLFMHNCICVFTMMVLCRQKLRFPKHGRSQVKKVLCFYIWYDHHVGLTSRGGYPHSFTRASIEAWRMAWHLSSHGSRGWLRNWGRLYLQRGQFSSYHKSGNKIWQFKQWYILNCNNIIATWGAYYLARIPV